ncbi:DEAD/DEAH box helicase [Faecalibacterium prausnitzii]|jgi:superfamily II DNA or RNA helicase
MYISENHKKQGDFKMTDYAPGMRAVIRDEEWLIKKIETNSLGHQVLQCVGITPLVRNRDTIFLTDLEQIQIVDPASIQLIADSSPFFKRSLLYLESQWRQQLPTDRNLHIGHKAAMDPMPYQLDPTKLSLQRPRQRILIADTVGLGKTLEAGILMSELIARGKGKRILVVTVKSMMTQFQKEMWNRFTIPLVRLDSNRIQKIRASLPSNYNPFFYYDKTIVSIDTLKRDVEYRTHLEKAYWDIIVIDEAHNVAERGDHQAQRSRLAKLLANRSDTMIMLSATPHDGRAKSFASLMNMLDPTAIADPENYTPEDIKGLCIRRFKNDVKDQVNGSFLERQVTLEHCHASAQEEHAFDLLAEMQLEMDAGKANNTGRLFKTNLEKSLFSSPAACCKSIEARLKKLYKKYTVDDISDIRLLEELHTALGQVTPENFTRYQKLLELLRSDSYGWNPKDPGDRVVIFTERIETMNYLVEHLRTDLGLKSSAIQEISGGMSDAEQQRIVEDFGRTESPIRILVASDVASEGLNLHYLSHRLIHFDIPWSLMVFQQRNGRIDRYGQQKRPDIRYLLIESNNKQIKGDMRIIEILIQKEEQALKNIGDPALLLGKFNVEEEETVIAEAIESGSDADTFAQSLDADAQEFNPFEALMAAASETEETAIEQLSETVSDETLFTDKEYLEQAVQYLNQTDSNPVQELQTVSGLDIRLTPEMERRLRALIPEEAMPQGETLRLSDDKAFCMEQMRTSMQKNMDEAAWPSSQYLWKLHPIFSWVNDKAGLLFKRAEAPVLGLPGVLYPGEALYIVSGSVPNLKSTPLIDEWFGLLYRDGQFIQRLSMEEVVQKAGLRSARIPNTNCITNQSIVAASGLLHDVVTQAKTYLTERYQQYQAEMNPKLDAEVDKLIELQEKHKEYYQTTLFEHERQLQEQERRVDKLFDDFTNWVKETLTIQNNPYIRIVSVLMGVSE